MVEMVDEKIGLLNLGFPGRRVIWRWDVDASVSANYDGGGLKKSKTGLFEFYLHFNVKIFKKNSAIPNSRDGAFIASFL
jgi:hypothetical protein